MSPRSEWLLFMTLAAGLGALIAFGAHRDYESIKAAEVARLVRLTEIINKNIGHSLSETHQGLVYLAREVKAGIDAPSGKWPDLHLKRFALINSVRTIAIVNKYGVVLDSDKPELVGINFSSSERYNAIKGSNASNLLHVFSPYVTPLGNYAMSLGVVVNDAKGGFGGYVLATLDPEYFATLLSSLVYAPDMRLGVIHQNGGVIYSVPDHERIIGENLLKVPGAVFPAHLSQNKSQTWHESRTAAFKNIRYTSYMTVFPENFATTKSLYVYASRDPKAIFESWGINLYKVIGIFLSIVVAGATGLIAYQRRHRALLHSELQRDTERMDNKAQVSSLSDELEGKVSDRTKELQKSNVELAYQSHHDILTGLHNRRYITEHLRSEFLRMRRTGSGYAVLIMDIDFFKNVNDTYGHSTGDRVLRNVADVVRSSVRETDFVARYGGEEFLVLLPDADAAGAALAAEKIRAAVAAGCCPDACPVTVSIGLAMSTPDDGDEDVAVGLADSRLYVAKSSGRNQVVAQGARTNADS